MREERLLERIRSRNKDPHRRSREDVGRTMDSVLGHLQRILNTRQGNVPIAEDYGVPDFTDLLHGYPQSLRDFEGSIRRTIRKYEPRLRSVRVNFIPKEEGAFSLRFQITGRLATEDHQDPVFFESVVGADGKISVKG
ncbi:MAG: type VI secretion system baseplate subunit TssE [Deltaproteobacteria bacterium]|nr:type VI secretion system baseplate subunit TssE [Deltaproteobacteria bacterium]